MLLGHVKCAAYELPFEEGESYAKGGRRASCITSAKGIISESDRRAVLLDGGGISGGRSVASLRHQRKDFLIIDITRPEHRVVIGEMDRYTVPMLLHEHAIYMHEGQQYQVEKLDFTEKRPMCAALTSIIIRTRI